MMTLAPNRFQNWTITSAALALLLCAAITPPAAAQDITEDGKRPFVFTCGIMWAHWFESEQLPERFRDNPRAYNQAQLDLIKEMGGTAVWANLDWCILEEERGVMDWTNYDAQIEDITSRGLTVYAYVGSTPRWARPEEYKDHQGAHTPPAEEYLEDFNRYMRAVAERYKDTVQMYLFWNEPNGCGFIHPGCANSHEYPLYTRWLKRAYTALKAGNPDCMVGAGVLDYNHGVHRGWEYIEGIYNEGGKNYLDAIVIHPYDPQGVHWRAIHDTRKVMIKHGDAHKPTWVEEYGWVDSHAPDAPERLIDFLTRITQPEYNYVTLCRYLIVSDLIGGGYGLCDRELNPRPIYDAYKAFPKDAPSAMSPGIVMIGADFERPPVVDLLALPRQDAGVSVKWSENVRLLDDESADDAPARAVPPPDKGPGRFATVSFAGPDADWAGYEELEFQVQSEGGAQLSLVLYEWDGERRESYGLQLPTLDAGRQTLRFRLRAGEGGDLVPTSPGSDGVWNPDPGSGVQLLFADYPNGFTIEGMRLLRHARDARN